MILLEVAPGVRLALAVPEGARDEGEGALASIDVSAVPGARVVLRRALRSDELRVQVACVLAPSSRWAPGLEELVLGRATGLATASLRASVERWEAGGIEAREGRFEQRLVGRAKDGERAGIEHTLAFVGAEHEVLLCSVGCASDVAGTACGEVLARSEVTGALVGPPPPSMLVRAVLFVAEKPYESVVGLAAIAVAAIVVVLARRPKVPGRRDYP